MLPALKDLPHLCLRKIHFTISHTMRLLNTKKIRVESFKPNEIPDYAILSHRWGDSEVSFKDIQSGASGLHDKEGYKKIERCCDLAVSVGFEYVWIDTCCIVKKDGLELPEDLELIKELALSDLELPENLALRENVDLAKRRFELAMDDELAKELASMFSYYRNAQVSYAYLSDVPSNDDPRAPNSKFRNSVWFTRGWTLQELLAPLYVTFFSSDWKEIGTKASLQKVISEITGISSQVLLTNYAGEISVAERKAWGKKRKTSAEEDEAYCLMGLLGVSMPVIYGEKREKALERLDNEIARLSNDSSTDPNRFDVSSWMRPEPEYHFFVSIQQYLHGVARIEYPELEPKWTISKEETRLWFGGSGNSGVLIFKGQGGQVFAVCLGVHNYNVWCAIAADCGDDIRKVAKEFWNGDKSGARWDNMDRRSMRLSSGELVSIAMRKGRRDGNRAYLIEISAGEQFWLDKVGPGAFPGWWKG